MRYPERDDVIVPQHAIQVSSWCLKLVLEVGTRNLTALGWHGTAKLTTSMGRCWQSAELSSEFGVMPQGALAWRSASRAPTQCDQRKALLCKSA